MKQSTKASGAAIATAAALLFSTVAVNTAGAAEAKMHCTGVNACKGQSACKTASNECRGMNTCKGQGFKEMTQQECDATKAKMKSE
jgi:hypothetical protein